MSGLVKLLILAGIVLVVIIVFVMIWKCYKAKIQDKLRVGRKANLDAEFLESLE